MNKLSTKSALKFPKRVPALERMLLIGCATFTLLVPLTAAASSQCTEANRPRCTNGYEAVKDRTIDARRLGGGDSCQWRCTRKKPMLPKLGTGPVAHPHPPPQPPAGVVTDPPPNKPPATDQTPIVVALISALATVLTALIGFVRRSNRPTPGGVEG